MTPQELYEETKSILDSDIQAKQQQLNQLTTIIIGNQKLVEGLKKVDGVSEEENT